MGNKVIKSDFKKEKDFHLDGKIYRYVKYLARGAMKVAFLYKKEDGTFWVVKKTNYPQVLVTDTDLQNQVALLASMFSKTNKSVIFIKPKLLKNTDGLFMLEEYVGDSYEKFTSNNGWDSNKSKTLSAFQHWTYHKSKGTQVVCDLQGVETKDGYLLTDPVVLSESGDFGDCDLGLQGINDLMLRHKCNEICKGWPVGRFTKPVYDALKPTSTRRIKKPQ